MQIQYAVEHVATVFAAISGAMAGRHQITLYATASLCGATMFAILHSRTPMSVVWTMAIATTLLLRLAAIRLELRLPLFQPK